MDNQEDITHLYTQPQATSTPQQGEGQEDITSLYKNTDEIPPPMQTSATGAFLRGGLQGATFGFGDEIQGALQTAGSGDYSNLLQTYRQYRDAARAANDLAQKEHPSAYGSGTLVGGAASTLLPVVGELGMGAKGATLLGGLSGLGFGTADLTKGQVGQAAMETGLGAGIGYTGNKVLQGFLPGQQAASQGLENAATSLAQRSVNAPLGAITAKAEQVAASPYNLETIGQTLLKEGIPLSAGKQKLVSTIDQHIDTLEGQLQDVLSKSAQKINAGLEDKTTLLQPSDFESNLQKLAQDTADTMANIPKQGPKAARAFLDQQQDYLEGNVLQKQDDILGLNKIKRDIYKEMDSEDWEKASPIQQEYQKDLAIVIKNRIEELAGQADPGQASEVANINNSMGNLITAKKAIQKTTTPKWSISDLGLGTIALGLHNPLPLAAAGVKKGIEYAADRPFGNLASGLGAQTLQGASTRLATNPNVFSQAASTATSAQAIPTLDKYTANVPENKTSNSYTPGEFMQFATKAYDINPTLGLILQKAAQGNDLDRSQALYNMGTNPAYKSQMEQLGMKTDYSKPGSNGR